MKPFVPYKPQEIVLLKITKREAILLQKLRKYPYGKFTVYKSDGLIVRVEINNSEMIEETTALELLE